MIDFWILKMAWRDSRGSRRRLLLFLASMVLGVAALVAINSFGASLKQAVDDEAKTLLGADLVLSSNRPFTEAAEALIDSLGGVQSRQVSFSSMALFPRTGDTRLATVRALQGDYPYYGEIETSPARAAAAFRTGRNALVDGTLMEQFGVQMGDSVRIGTRNYLVAGRLEKTPRESAAVMLFSPRIYVPLEELDTSLLQRGSRADYEVLFQFEDGRDVEALVDDLKPVFRERRIGFDTIQEVREDWDEGLTNLYKFLALVGFIALLLGGLGVASAVHVYVKQRIETVAVLRCLGAAGRRTFAVYLSQAAALGVLGALVGCLLGVGVQTLLPRVLGDFLPVPINFAVSWSAVLLGFVVGVGVTLAFALLPLLTVRRVSPLRALRASVEEAEGGRDPLRWAVFMLLAAGLVGFAVVQAPYPVVGLWYAGGVAVVFGLLALVAKGVIWGARRFLPASWAYPWRQGLANLYRPNNQTLVLMLALGLGTFLIASLFLVQRTLLAQVELAGDAGRPDAVLFDIQPTQLEEVSEAVRAEGLPVLDQVPIVSMRLHAVKGRTVDDLRADTTFDDRWAHNREYRSSYRDYLTEAETILEGTFVPAMPEEAGAIPVTVERDIAEELAVTLGDTLVWDVQGVKMASTVAGIREVDWRRLSTNFFVLFPTGVLEEAPQFHVLLTRTESKEASASLQRTLVDRFPNVSVIDLSLVLDVFDAIFSRVAFVIRFMALFSILTGLIVLAGAVLVSRYQRIQESVLLKTLGASRQQVFKILLIEYLFLGLFAAFTGLVLALGASWALAFFVFETPLVAPPVPLVLALVGVTGLTVGIGLLNSRGVYRRPPLEVLRAEV